MRFTSKVTSKVTSKFSRAFAVMAAIALTTAAADAASRHLARHHEQDPYAFNGAYNAAGPTSERFSGTSVPYDADGPVHNDFQLQGR